jgi:ATP phosphoribosyltransferase regulatory subunit
MSESNRWLLPDGVDEMLPPEAWAHEQLRRTILDSFRTFGYELVSPPLIEYLESLLTGTGNNLDLQTFKVTDQLTGRMMGVRADITPQIARIDSHLLKRKGLSRLCYADTVLHTRAEHLMTTRCPMQIGCELFGEAGQAADLEVITLMLETLHNCRIEAIHVDLAHVGIYRGLVENSGLLKADALRLFDALSRKSLPELEQLAASVEQGAAVVSVIKDIAELSGGTDTLAQIRENVKALSQPGIDSVLLAIDELEAIREELQNRFPHIEMGFDFCELRGYDYHTGVMFAAYTPGYGHALAKGGRYDDIGKDFGVSRPATGFSADLKTLVRVGSTEQSEGADRVWAPMHDDAAYAKVIADLRQTCTVVQQLSEGESPVDCNKILVQRGDRWEVDAL